MEKVLQILTEIGIPYEKHEHPPVFTVEEAAEHYENIPGGQCKNLFLRDKRGRRHFLAIVESRRAVDLPILSDVMEEKKLGFASDERLMQYLGLTSGSVSPFGLINDTDKEVGVILDENLLDQELLHFHPNINTASLVIKSADLVRFLEWSGQEVRSFRF